jgi:hypothetical protein
MFVKTKKFEDSCLLAASTSEMSVNFYQTTQRNSTEDSHLHTRRRENLKSHQEICFPQRKRD